MKPRKIKGSKISDALKMPVSANSSTLTGDVLANKADKMIEALQYSINDVISKGADTLEFNFKIEISVVGLDTGEDDE